MSMSQTLQKPASPNSPPPIAKSLPAPNPHDPQVQRAEMARRIALAKALLADPAKQAIAKAHLRHNIADFFNDWLWTYDPRVVGINGLSAWMPFRLFPKQEEFVLWWRERVRLREEWLLDKSRDVGATYLCCGGVLHQWLFEPGFKGSFGSRDADLVDNREDPDSIFQKLRIMRMMLPAWLQPEGFDPGKHDLVMRMINPENGNIITGEAGTEMGRGGRSTVYILDEAAFVPRAERVQAALSGTTDCIGWVSTVSGMGNLFARKRYALPSRQVFTLHWKDDPRKGQAWADRKQKELNDPVIWASEYEIDYSASVEGVCIPAKWVKAAQELASLEPKLPRGSKIGGLDIGGGKAKSVLIVRDGVVVLPPESRTDPDTTDTAFWALDICNALKTDLLNWDAPGVGLGVTSTMNKAEGYNHIQRQPVNTGSPPTFREWPGGKTSEDIFVNLKAELWGLGRARFQATFEHVQFLKGISGGKKHPLSDLIALPADPALALQLSLPKRLKNEKGKLLMEGKLKLAQRGIPSHDEADALMLTFLDELDDGTKKMDLSGAGLHRDNPWTIR